MAQQHHNASKKRRREPITVDTKLVEMYEDLANERDEIRLKAAQALVSQFTPDKNPTDEQIKKTLSRLFRGLCSSRKAARVGFSIALTEILTQVFATTSASSEVTIPFVLGIWESQSNASGSETGQEHRDHHFGRLFGAEAIIKSSILFQKDVPLEEWTKLLDLVFDLAKKKPWIREECGWIIYRCVHDLSAQKVDPKFVETALDRLCSNDLARTPEGIAIWLAAKELFPHVKYPGNIWKYDSPLDSREKSTLAKIMKESSTVESDGDKQSTNPNLSGVWNSKLHFAWDAVISRLSDSAAAKEKSKDKAPGGRRLTFAEFWTEVVDNGLFASASSDERKYWGFLLFVKVLNERPVEQASVIFSKNLVRSLTNQLADQERYLHRIAAKAAKSIQARVSKDPEFAAAAVKGLMGPAGSVKFDQVTKTKTVEKIVTEANLAALEHIVPFLGQLVASPGTDDSKVAASNRQVLAGILLAIVRSRVSASKDSEEGCKDVLELILLIFIRFGYFKAKSDSKSPSAASPALTDETQELFRNRINSCLNALLNNEKYATVFPYVVVRKIRDAAKSEEFGKFIIEMDETISKSIKTAFKTLKKISSQEKKTGSSSLDAFKLLYSMIILQVYNGDSDAVSMLEELEFCSAKFMEEKKGSKGDDLADASDALVEILLSFASKPSQLFRRMSEQVFGAFADQVTENGLDSLVSILEAKESLAGQQQMFEDQDDEEEGDAMDVDEMDSDVEVIEANGSESSDEEDDDDEEDDIEDDGEADQNDKDLAAFEAKLAEALGTHRADQDLEAQSEESDADMNDDEMAALDDQLVKVFRARQQVLSKKQDKKDAKETMTNFKNRVLDLLEIFVKKCHSKVLALDLLLPLLRVTRRSAVKQIASKANGVLREYTKLCKGAAVPKVDSKEPLLELLRSVHKEATHSGPPVHASACSQASLLVVKVLVAHERSAVQDVVDVYAATRKEQLMSKKCHVQPAFFTDWNNWCVSASKQLKE